MPHQPARFCIKQNSIDFGCREACVYRDCSSAQPAAGVDQLDGLRRIRQQKREAVARRKAVGGERSRNVLNVAPWSVADPFLLAVEDPGVALAFSGRRQAACCSRANQWLGQAEAADRFKACHRWRPFLFLLFRSVEVDRAHRQAIVHAKKVQNDGSIRASSIMTKPNGL